MNPLRIAAPLAIATSLLTLPVGGFAAPAKITYTGGNGTSLEKAVIINGATQDTGVRAESTWLAKHYHGCQFLDQIMESHGGRAYDTVHVAGANGKKHEIYFDVTDIYGK